MRNNHRYLLFTLTLASFLLTSNTSFTQSKKKVAEEVERYTHQVMSDWKIPGMAVAIIKDNQLVLQKGFGVKSLASKTPVDEHTVFQIGSVTKSFTAALVAMLVDEGKLSWDDPVRKHLPDFQMFDPWASDNLLVKDIMVHRTGLPYQAGTYLPNLGYSRDDIYRMLRLIKPSSSLRTQYDYNNITFVIAQKLIEKYSGKTWEQNLRERIFLPLGMSHSSSNAEGFLASQNVSDSYEVEYEDSEITLKYLEGEDRALEWHTAIGPAGSINASISDLIRWAQFHLNKGVIGDSAIISRKNIDFLHRGQTITRQDSVTTSVYGQCWFIEQNNRYRLYFHTGTTWGFTTLVAFVPQLNLGIAILVNSEASADPRYAIMRKTIDLYMNDGVKKDYNKEYIEKYHTAQRKKEEEQKAKKLAQITLPAPLMLADYQGKYQKEIFGEAVVSLENEQLWITIGPKKWKKPMTHVSGNKFSFRMDGHTFPLVFETDYNGKVVSFNIDFEYDENFGSWAKAL